MSEKNKRNNQQSKSPSQSSNTKPSSTNQPNKGVDRSDRLQDNHQSGKENTSAPTGNTVPNTSKDQVTSSTSAQSSDKTGQQSSQKTSTTQSDKGSPSSSQKSSAAATSNHSAQSASDSKNGSVNNAEKSTIKSSSHSSKISSTSTTPAKETTQHSSSKLSSNSSNSANKTADSDGHGKAQAKSDTKNDPKASNAKSDEKPNKSPASSSKTTNSNGADKPSVSKINKSDDGKPKGGHGLTYLALAIALAGLGLSLYNNFNEDNSATGEISTLQQRLNSLENTQNNDQSQQSIEALNKQVAQLQSQLSANKPQSSLSKEEVSALIEQQLSQQPQALTVQQIKEYIDSELASANDKDVGMTEQQVQTQIKQALANLAQDIPEMPAYDFSAEIAQVEQSQQQAQQAVNEVEKKASDIQRTLEEQAQSIQAQVSKANNQANPYPILNLLRLANTTAQTGHAAPAAFYLEQALEEFATFKLEQPPFAAFKEDIEQQARKMRSIAEADNPAQSIDSIIDGIDQWPFKQANVPTDSTPTMQESESGFMASVKNIGRNILDNTISVTRNDADGLVWINENAQLQQLIRHNVRLDLAYARNALFYQDVEAYNAASTRLQENIARYFDGSNANVEQALKTLASINPQQTQLPNLSDLIEQFSQAASKE